MSFFLRISCLKTLLTMFILTAALSKDIPVNTYQMEKSYFPRITVLSDGGYVIVWKTYSQSKDHYRHYAKRYFSDGSLYEPQFLVNNDPITCPYEHSIAPLTDGGYIIVWTTVYNSSEFCSRIVAQRFHANNSKYGPELQPNISHLIIQVHGKVTALPDGGYVIGGCSPLPNEKYNFEVYAQRYHSNNTKYGNNIPMTAGTKI